MTFNNKDFYPTPSSVIDMMLYGIELNGKVVLEPSAGKGDIVDACIGSGASLLACEMDNNLRKIVQSKCKVIANDFLTVTSDAISHIDAIIMNPPFSADDKHILHAWDIAPDGCDIVALCNLATVKNTFSSTRQRLSSIISEHGSHKNLGSCFDTAERTTNVEVAMIRLKKTGENKKSEFDGFFMDEEQEEQGNGIMSYNAVRDLVNRYVAAVKLFDKQIEIGQQMNALTGSFFGSQLSFTCTVDKAPVLRNDFKKDLQKSAWQWVFGKMNMNKYATRGLKEDINKFVEQQTAIPFTMRNIYHMINIVVGTHSQRMDKAIIEVFEKLTKHTHENRFSVEGWKTNDTYLIGEKIIMPGVCYQDRWNKGGDKIDFTYYTDTITDFVKALCFITGNNYDDIGDIRETIRKDNHLYGDLFEWAFFNVRCYKKGTAHFQFKDREVWATLNQHIARIKGFALPEKIKKYTK